MNKKGSIYLALCLLFGLMAVGCGGSSDSRSDTLTNEFAVDTAGSFAGFDTYGTQSYDDGAVEVAEEEEESVYNEEDATYEDAAYDDASYEAATEASKSAEVELTEDKIIYSGSLTLETQEYEDTLSGVSDLISSYGGIIESRDESSGSYDWYSNSYYGSRSTYIVVRIPSERFEEFLDSLGDVGHVTDKTSNAENITRDYQNVSIEIEALEKEEARLLEMMDAATTIEEMIQVESRLTEVQSQLNQYLSQRNTYDTDVKYSTVRISVNEVGEYTKTEEPGFGTRLREAFSGSWENVVDFVQGLIIFLIYAIPVLLVLGILAFVVVKIVKKILGKRKRKKSAKDGETP